MARPHAEIASALESPASLTMPRATGGWTRWMLRAGHRSAVLVITLASMVASVLLTTLANLTMGNMANLQVDIVIAVLVPAVVAPLASYYPVGLLFELDRARKLLEVAANRDALTGLFNRRFLLARLDEAIATARSGSVPLSLILIDIDSFKAINDRYGHAAGDRVLLHFARVLEQVLGRQGLVARYGGEEFVALLSGVSIDQARALAERARAELESSPVDVEPSVPGGVKVTASLGITAMAAGRETADRLLASADQAMYAAKTAGRNRCIASAAPD